MPAIRGRITNQAGTVVQEAKVTAMHAQDEVSATTNANGQYTLEDLAAGTYTVSVTGLPQPMTADDVKKYLPAHVDVFAGIDVEGIDFSLNVVQDFLDRLDDARFSIESPISVEEANQAVSLFSVATLLLAGLGQRHVGNDDKIDVLGILSLYYGLQEGSLNNRLTIANPTLLWSSIESELKALAKDLDQLQADVDFVTREAKRQFNLGRSNGVLANVQFPGLFKRYAEIGTDPLLALDLRQEERNQFFDKTRLAQADDLLKELKGLLLQIVRALSKYGTAATRRANEDWARFEARALEVLTIVAQNRVTPDLDEKNNWSVLAAIAEKNRETEVAPYVVLARHGGKLLRYAMEIYGQTQDQLDNFDRDHLRDLFQPQQQEFWTTRIRKEATVLKRYPLANWG